MRFTFVHAGVLVLEDGELVDLTELLEHRAQSVLLEVTGYLADEQFNRTVALAARRRRRYRYQHVNRT